MYFRSGHLIAHGRNTWNVDRFSVKRYLLFFRDGYFWIKFPLFSKSDRSSTTHQFRAKNNFWIIKTNREFIPRKCEVTKREREREERIRVDWKIDNRSDEIEWAVSRGSGVPRIVFSRWRGGGVRKGQVRQRAPRGVVSVGGPRRRAPMPAHIAANSGALSDPKIPIFRPR